MPKLTHIRLVRVQYVPKVLEPGLLYVAEEFGAAVHLCACGCGTKVSTPLGPTEWSLQEFGEGPSLRPSVGNWQHPCRAHYWINRGEIVWSGQWTPEQIEAGRRAEEQRRREYYDDLERKREGFWKRIWRWIKRLFGYTA
jgi:hypothetical protein